MSNRPSLLKSANANDAVFCFWFFGGKQEARKQGNRKQKADSLLENAMCFISQDSSLCRAYIRGHTPYPNCFADCIHHQKSNSSCHKKRWWVSSFVFVQWKEKQLWLFHQGKRYTIEREISTLWCHDGGEILFVAISCCMKEVLTLSLFARKEKKKDIVPCLYLEREYRS